MNVGDGVLKDVGCRVEVGTIVGLTDGSAVGKPGYTISVGCCVGPPHTGDIESTVTVK